MNLYNLITTIYILKIKIKHTIETTCITIENILLNNNNYVFI